MSSALAAGILVLFLALNAAERPAPRPVPAPPSASVPVTVERATIPDLTPPLAGSPPQPLEHASRAARVHEVVRGETLWSISRRALGNPFSWRAVYAANRASVADPDRIEPGQRLTIPVPPPAPARPWPDTAQGPAREGWRPPPARR